MYSSWHIELYRHIRVLVLSNPKEKFNALTFKVKSPVIPQALAVGVVGPVILEVLAIPPEIIAFRATEIEEKDEEDVTVESVQTAVPRGVDKVDESSEVVADHDRVAPSTMAVVVPWTSVVSSGATKVV